MIKHNSAYTIMYLLVIKKQILLIANLLFETDIHTQLTKKQTTFCTIYFIMKFDTFIIQQIFESKIMNIIIVEKFSPIKPVSMVYPLAK